MMGWFIFGVMVGTVLGIILAALMVASREDDDER